MTRRKIKDRLKQLFFLLYKLGVRLGLYIIPVHYYSSEPNILELERTKDTWAKPSSLPGIHVDLAEQTHNLSGVCVPFQQEYVGNATYKTAVQDKYGPGFGYIEAQVLHSVVRYYRPARIIEVGSGVSTFCSYVASKRNADEGEVECQITCIEPYPSSKLRKLADEQSNVHLVAQPVQTVPLDIFTELSSSDILFVDSSHTVKAGSDVNHIVLEILPRLNTGVLVHFHDIYFPYDYQRDVLLTFLHNNETSILRAFLTFNNRLRILFCMSHLHYERQDDLKTIFPDYNPQSDLRGLRDENYDSTKHFPSSIWLETCGLDGNERHHLR